MPELFPCIEKMQLYGAFSLIKWDYGAHRGGLGYTHKCIIETVGWFGILTDYCNIFVLIL
jgi:hypothetical protein